MHKLIVMLRVKDGIFFVHEWLENLEKLVDEIVVLDNGSTDGTFEVLSAHPKVTAIERTYEYHEGRDKNMMYEMARTRKPDWCLWIDVDEMFEPEVTRKDFDKMMDSKIFNKFAFRRFHFIDREYFAGSPFRLRYSAGHDRMMWRESPNGYFENFIIDSPNVKGIKGVTKKTSIRLKHLGYINKELVDKKADIYRGIIPEKESTFQEMYLHNERRIKWIDKRSSFKVRGLNIYLSFLRLITVIPRIPKKLFSMVTTVLNKA